MSVVVLVVVAVVGATFWPPYSFELKIAATAAFLPNAVNICCECVCAKPIFEKLFTVKFVIKIALTIHQEAVGNYPILDQSSF